MAVNAHAICQLLPWTLVTPEPRPRANTRAGPRQDHHHRTRRPRLAEARQKDDAVTSTHTSCTRNLPWGAGSEEGGGASKPPSPQPPV
jgi:hypothetical protein